MRVFIGFVAVLLLCHSVLAVQRAQQVLRKSSKRGLDYPIRLRSVGPVGNLPVPGPQACYSDHGKAVINYDSASMLGNNICPINQPCQIVAKGDGLGALVINNDVTSMNIQLKRFSVNDDGESATHGVPIMCEDPTPLSEATGCSDVDDDTRRDAVVCHVTLQDEGQYHAFAYVHAVAAQVAIVSSLSSDFPESAAPILYASSRSAASPPASDHHDSPTVSDPDALALPLPD